MSGEHQQGSNQPPKIVTMPDREILARQLQGLGVFGISEQSNTFFQRYTEYLADTKINAAGIYMTWVNATADTLSGYPPMVSSIIDMYFDRVVDAVIPDPEVADEAKEIRRKIMEEISALSKAAEPKVEDLGPEDSIDDLTRYTQARRVADVVFEFVSRNAGDLGDGIWVEDRREEEVNPFYHQTHRGFFLEQYYSNPSKLWTPWGEYGFAGSGSSWDDISRKKLLERLGATIYRPQQNTNYGVVGPIYALHKIDDIELPEPVARPRSAYKEYDEIKNIWRKLTSQYYQSKGETPPLTIDEKFTLDNALLEERGKNEPPLNENDIRNLWEIAFHRGEVIKYTQDEGKTWHYTKISDSDPVYFQGGELGYSTDEEVLPHIQVHSSRALTDKRFEAGLVARPTNQEEIKGLVFSYDFKDLKDSDS